MGKIEIWINVNGYESKYQVSSLGRLKSLERFKKSKNNSISRLSEKICKPISLNNDYCKYDIKDNGRNKQVLVHRLVAEHFLLNDKLLPCINHKNGIKSDNRVENLEWISYFENSKHASDILMVGQKINSISQFDLTGKFIKEFRSISDIQKQLGYSKANIHKHLKGHPRYNTCYGFIWKYT